MKPGLEPGRFVELHIRVTPQMCPHFDGVLKHPVLATWSLVHHIELAGRKLLEPHLEDQEEGVGVHVSIDHRAPAPIGSTVTVRAEVESVSPRRLACRVTARSGERLIAEGAFVQAILPKSRLRELFEGRAPNAAGQQLVGRHSCVPRPARRAARR